MKIFVLIVLILVTFICGNYIQAEWPEKEFSFIMSGAVKGGMGQVFIVEIKTEVSKKLLARDVMKFNCNTKGDYALKYYHNKNWHYGTIGEKDSDVILDFLPEETQQVSVSPSGRRIACVLIHQDKAGLIIYDLLKREDNCYFQCPVKLADPSWSPDETSIAVYKSKSIIQYEGMQLMLASCLNGRMSTEILTPPGRRVGAATTGILPKWSPTGERILFLGSYKDDSVSPWHVIELKNKKITEASWGEWIGDNDLVGLVNHPPEYDQKFITCQSGENITTTTKFSQDEERIKFFKPSPDGKCIVYAIGWPAKIYLLDLQTKERKFLTEIEGTCEFFWIENPPPKLLPEDGQTL